ncbi:MAG TPA: hypothetical protein VIW24_13305 [Aldersonia sp.]
MSAISALPQRIPQLRRRSQSAAASLNRCDEDLGALLDFVERDVEVGHHGRSGVEADQSVRGRRCH